ncbi:MAG: sigma-70 family RNA polymerase sigma factor [candidate division Zixibacteria bacterium]|nr:sigma-70 family RNA polymerase sigma factor [candidate division Zixibacteria bacterium]
MECIQRADTSAFNELYDRYSRRLLHYFFRELGGDKDKAQDFLQEIFLKIVQKSELFNTEKKFSTWVFTVAYNMCKNEYRRQQVRMSLENDADVDNLSYESEREYSRVEKNMDNETFARALLRELATLHDGLRSAFLLRYQQNLSIREIGEILGCSEGTVKSRLFYATRKLAAKLKAFNPHRAEVSRDEKIR